MSKTEKRKVRRRRPRTENFNGENEMRKLEELQMKLGEEDISRIQFDPRSRDEIPKIKKVIPEIQWMSLTGILSAKNVPRPT